MKMPNSTKEGYTNLLNSAKHSDGIIYYRLKIVDKDGNVSYSPVRIIRLTHDKQGHQSFQRQ
jgi:hypothetical protein